VDWAPTAQVLTSVGNREGKRPAWELGVSGSQCVTFAGGWWLVLICCERKGLLAGCWWLVCSERKVLLPGG
jgi:hypothetical protein